MRWPCRPTLRCRTDAAQSDSAVTLYLPFDEGGGGPGSWCPSGRWSDDEVVRVAPFDALPLPLTQLWPE